MSLVIEECPSPNHGERRTGPVDILLLHYTGMPDCRQALEWLRTPESQVSAHYVVMESGTVARLVPEHRRAWHAGAGRWAGETDINSRSIGIEICHDGDPTRPYPAAQIAAVTELCQGILSRHAIPPHRVLAHSDTAPDRKIDPGHWFPWAGLAAEGIGHWVPPVGEGPGVTLARGDEGPAVADLQSWFIDYGYGLAPTGLFDEATEQVVRAFQRHFRPWRVDGMADPSTAGTLLRLLEALGPRA